MGAFQDKTGMRFGRLVVVSRAAPHGKERRAFWLCRCDCGTEKVINGHNLSCSPTSGKTTSCGCLKRERTATIRASHRQSGTRTHRIWKNMLSRCRNSIFPSFADYGGRGITVCSRWLDFAAFRSDMGDAPHGRSLDRIDNAKGYSPENCRWATAKEQAANKRGSIYVPTAQGMFSLSDFAARIGRPYETVREQAHRGEWQIVRPFAEAA